MAESLEFPPSQAVTAARIPGGDHWLFLGIEGWMSCGVSGLVGILSSSGMRNSLLGQSFGKQLLFPEVLGGLGMSEGLRFGYFGRAVPQESCSSRCFSRSEWSGNAPEMVWGGLGRGSGCVLGMLEGLWLRDPALLGVFPGKRL